MMFAAVGGWPLRCGEDGVSVIRAGGKGSWVWIVVAVAWLNMW